jgi:AcrR family transcriptional regulator
MSAAEAISLGISKTALFSYYKTKDEIFNRLIREAMEELGRILAENDRSAPTAHEWLRSFISGYIAFGMKHPDEYRLAFMVVKSYGKQPQQTGEGAHVGLAVFEQVEKRVSDLIGERVIRRDLGPPAVVAQVLWGRSTDWPPF